jgi:hypothetical protein
MSLRIAIDTSTALARVVGEGAGFSRHHLTAQLPRFKEVHASMNHAIDAGLLPHFQAWADPKSARAAKKRAARWRKAADRFIVLGSPDAVAAIRVLAELGDIAEKQSVRWVVGPDPVLIAAAFHSCERPWLIVLDGPPWVRRLGAGLWARVVGGTVFAGDGSPTEAWSLGDAERVAVPGAADPRFGVLGEAALSLMAVTGVDPIEMQTGIESAQSACRGAALFDNPSYRLAALLHTASGTLNLSGVDLLCSTPRLLPWVSWLQNAWAAITGGILEGPAISRRTGLRPSVVQLANECAMERAVTGPADRLTLALWVDNPGQDVAIGDADTAWLTARDMMDQQVALLVGARRPVLRVRIPELSTVTIAELSVVFVHALLAMVTGWGGEPLAMNAADAFRSVRGRA